MIVGGVQSSEVFKVEGAVGALLKAPAAAVADTRQGFYRAGRAWLVENHPGCSGGFADVVLEKAWAQHTVRTVRLELTASELAQLAALVGAAPASVAVEALRRKITDAAARLGVDLASQQQPPTDDRWEPAVSDPRSPCDHCRDTAEPHAEAACFCTEQCSAGRCQGGFRIIGHAVDGTKHLIGATANPLPQRHQVPAGEGMVFATAADVRRYVRENLNDARPRYWRVSVIGRDNGVGVGLGTRNDFDTTDGTWSWSGAVET